MTIAETENFYKQDAHKYILKENKTVLDFIKQKENEGINFILSIQQMQQLMDDIVLFFEFKFPNSFLNDLRYTNKKSKIDMHICQNLAKTLDINQLKYRLYHDYIQFLDCPYGNQIEITKKKMNLWDLTSISVCINNIGEIEPYDLKKLEEYGFLANTNGIQMASDLLGRFIESPINVNYSKLTEAVITHKTYIQLRNMILELIPYKLIYSESTFPEYGYIRAKSFVRMFNKEYNLNISMKEVNEIMHKNYSTKKVKVK